MITALRERRVGAGASDEPPATNRPRWLDPMVITPIVAVGVYIVTVATRLPNLLSSFYWYTDFPEALRLGDAVFHGGWGQGLPVPSQTGLGPLWVVGLLNQITGGDAAGMAFGAVMALVAAAFMVRTAHRVLGTTSAVAVAVLCIAAPPVVAWERLTPVEHGSTLVMTAVFAWQLVALSRPGHSRAVASSLAVGALAGVCAVSDPLVIAVAAVPWVICAVAIAHRDATRRVPVIATAGSAIGSAALVGAVATLNGIVERGNAVFSPSVQGITAGMKTTAVTLGQMITGVWYSDALPDAVAIVAFLLFAAVVYMAGREVTRRSPRTVPGREVYVWFWLLSSGGLVAAFCVSGLGIQYDPVSYQGHYVDGLWFALAALLPIGLLHPGVLRRVVAVSVTGLVLSAAAGVARAPSYPFEDPDYVDGPQLTAVLEQLGLTHGYGGYWESYAIGWHTNQRISALPLERCTYATGVRGLCRDEYAAPAWYRAQPGPIFVVAITASCYNNDLCINTANLAALPKPETVRTVGLLQVYVYSRDVLADLPMATRP